MSRTKSFSFSFTAVLLILFVAEILCAIALRFSEGSWIYTRGKNENYELFEPHPSLVGIPRKNISVTINSIHYKHNSQGFRGDEPEAQKTKKRIVCVGGSTTYCIGVNNNETWAYYLDSLLQPEYEVLNLGIPGHTTVEHKKLLPDALEKYAPDLVILHCGLNDLRNMHVQNLGNDYSEFHQPSLYASFGFCLQDRLPRSALVYVVFRVLQKISVIPTCAFRNEMPAGTLSDAVDERVVKIYKRNLDTLIAQCAENNIPVYLLPQVLSEEVVTDENLKWWIHYLSKKGIFNALNAMNNVLTSHYNINNEIFGPRICWETEFQKKDFFDASHLNAIGNLKIAEIVAISFSGNASASVPFVPSKPE